MIEEQFKFLKFMSEVTGRTDINEFSAKLGFTSEQTVGVIRDLVKVGFVRKTSRGYVITGKGKSALKAHALVPADARFIFYKALGQPTEMSAGSVKEFYDAVEGADVGSLEFHLYREDFDCWFREILVDEDFSNEIAGIRKQQLKGESLRESILNALKGKYVM